MFSMISNNAKDTVTKFSKHGRIRTKIRFVVLKNERY